MVNPEKFDFLKEEVPRKIVKRTRMSIGATEYGDKITFGKLSDGYIKYRKKFDDLSDFTNPNGLRNRSNLTLTGKMLEAIVGTRIGTRFIFFFKDPFSNQKAEWNSKTRPFFNLLKSEKNGIYREVSKIIREELRSIFKKLTWTNNGV